MLGALEEDNDLPEEVNKSEVVALHELPWWLSDKECRRLPGGDIGSSPGSGGSPWGRKWQPTLVFLPGESHGQRSLAGCSLWGHKSRR